MPFYNFNRTTNKASIVNPFIKNIALWSHDSLPIKLGICKYELAHFNNQLFEQYRVSVPSEIARSVPKRQAEFLAGRIIALYALSQLDSKFTSLDIAITKNRAPSWPSGITGSISHTTNIASSIVGYSSKVANLGIDIEDNMEEKVRDQIANQIHTPDEVDILRRLGISICIATTLIFSAKEALFKALYKSVRLYFGFECARVISADLSMRVLQIELEQKFRITHNLRSIYQVEFVLFNSKSFTLAIL